VGESQTETTSDLYEVLLGLKNKDEIYLFMKDLCTPQEIKALQERWRVCQLLEKNLSYRDISKITGASLTTIGRVARFLKEETYGGYRMVLTRMKEK
jgi:TrpR-related protein YerC/YecD